MILEAPIPSPSSRAPNVPPAVSAVVLKALARDREQRYANGREMARALEAAAGPLLQDAEQIAALMAEHFGPQMESTRRLLESADAVEVSDAPEGPPREALGETDSHTEVTAATRDDETRVVGRKPAAPPRRAREPEPEGAARAVATTGRRVAIRPSSTTKAVSSADEATVPPSPAKASPPWALIALLIGVGMALGFGAMKFLGGSSREPVGVVEPPPPPPGTDLSAPRPLAPPPPSTPPPAQPRLEAPPGATALAEGQQEGDKGPAEPDEKAEPTRPSRQYGQMTLVILPEAEVFLNGKSLGKTPLFKVQVPAGQHRLRIQGADGKKRELQAPIKPGKLVQFKLSLTDIPER